MSYCLGHTAAVTCCALCKVGKDGSDDQHVLVSGGLEGLVIVWNWVTGEQRCSMRLSQGEAENDLEGEGPPPPPLLTMLTHLCAVECRSL